jgi:DNA-binding protein H-NS
MSATNFDQLFKDLIAGIETIAKDSLRDYRKEAEKDGQQAIEDIKENLQQWTEQLEAGSITEEDLRYLLQEDESLTKMIALKQAGLAAVHIDQFKNDLIDMIFGKVIGVIKDLKN